MVIGIQKTCPRCHQTYTRGCTPPFGCPHCLGNVPKEGGDKRAYLFICHWKPVTREGKEHWIDPFNSSSHLETEEAYKVQRERDIPIDAHPENHVMLTATVTPESTFRTFDEFGIFTETFFKNDEVGLYLAHGLIHVHVPPFGMVRIMPVRPEPAAPVPEARFDRELTPEELAELEERLKKLPMSHAVHQCTIRHERIYSGEATTTSPPCWDWICAVCLEVGGKTWETCPEEPQAKRFAELMVKRDAMPKNPEGPCTTPQ
jgi:hypothetical protein